MTRRSAALAAAAQHRPWITRPHHHLHRRVTRYVGEYGSDPGSEFGVCGHFRCSGGRGERLTGDRVVGERLHDGHPGRPAKMRQRPTQRHAGVGGAVEADDHLEVIVHRWDVVRDQRDGDGGMT